MKTRYTVEVLASGQPRPYADSRQHVRVIFEIVSYKTGEWEPWDIKQEAIIRERLLGLKCGFVEFRYPKDCADPKKPSASEYFKTRLDWLKQTAPGVWEFHTTSAYTD